MKTLMGQSMHQKFRGDSLLTRTDHGYVFTLRILRFRYSKLLEMDPETVVLIRYTAQKSASSEQFTWRCH